MSDLKPCPFCGGEAELWRANGERTAWVACMGRCSILVSKEHKTDAEAIAAWNTRTAPDPAAIREAALREAAKALNEDGRHVAAETILALIDKGAE